MSSLTRISDTRQSTLTNTTAIAGAQACMWRSRVRVTTFPPNRDTALQCTISVVSSLQNLLSSAELTPVLSGILTIQRSRAGVAISNDARSKVTIATYCGSSSGLQ